MSKAITEVAIGAAAIGAAILLPGIGVALAPSIVSGLIGLGSSSIMGGLADALKPGQGGIAVGVTTPIGPWAYLYGTQKVGGVEIFRQSNSSQGTSNDKQLHRVYALACHPSVADAGSFQLRIDGRQVLLQPATYGYGWSSYSPTQIEQNIASISRDINGLVTVVLTGGIAGLDGQTISITECPDNTFNGTWIVTQSDLTDDTTFTFICGGPVTSQTYGNFWTLYSDYKDKIYVEFLDGNHTETFRQLLASGTSWSASDLCLGHTLVYVRMGWDAAVFPSSIPNVSFVINGKNDILDPRTGGRGFTNNAALCIADYLSLPPTRGGFGLAIGTDIPSAELIAAANLCDETVSLAGGGTIPRYECDTFFQLNAGRGSILKSMLTSCAGRLSYQGGLYSIFPGAAVSPTLQLSDADIIGSFQFKPRLSISETCNAVKGTYVSPENAYQQGDFPAYMQDAAHGYVSDPFLAEDQGERIFAETNFPCTVRSATAQRLAKIALMRTRYQVRGTGRFTMKAYRAVALDVIQLTHPRYTWINKNFEVLSSRFVWEKQNAVPIIAVELDLAETDPTIYDWSITEELTPQGYAQPSNVGNSACTPPEHVVAYSGPGETIDGIVYPSTITTTASGVSQNSIYVRWDQPNDANVVSGGHLELQWRLTGTTPWNALPNIAPSASSVFVNGVTDGAAYDVQIRAVNCANVPSQWIVAGSATVSNSLSPLAYSGVPVAPAGTLVAVTTGPSSSTIQVKPFTASILASTASCLPAGSVYLTGLAPQTMYYVYYVDPTFVGGAITPIATLDPADYVGQAGYFLIGAILTPSYAVTGYFPSGWSALGTIGILYPAAAYDGNLSTFSTTYGANNASWGAQWSEVLYAGFPSVASLAGQLLYVHAAAIQLYTLGARWAITASIGGGIKPSGQTGALNARGAWAATTAYAQWDTFTSGGVTYLVVTGYTSGGTFGATDVTNTCVLLATGTGAAVKQMYSVAIPTGTDLSTISVDITVNAPASPTGGDPAEELDVYTYEVYVQ